MLSVRRTQLMAEFDLQKSILVRMNAIKTCFQWIQTCCVTRWKLGHPPGKVSYCFHGGEKIKRLSGARTASTILQRVGLCRKGCGFQMSGTGKTTLASALSDTYI